MKFPRFLFVLFVFFVFFWLFSWLWLTSCPSVKDRFFFRFVSFALGSAPFGSMALHTINWTGSVVEVVGGLGQEVDVHRSNGVESSFPCASSEKCVQLERG